MKFCTNPIAKNRLVTHEKNVVARVMKYAGEHPNIVPLLEYNLDGEIPWLMYEYVEGGTLAGLIEEWRELPLPKRLGRAVRVLHAVASALAACHRLDPPLVHRDLKPHNILMAGSVPRIIDFGIGSVVMQPQADGATGALTAFAACLPSGLHAAGTRLYAPPEQMMGAPPNPRDDVYALGIIAYQMVLSDLTTVPSADAAMELRDLKVPSELVSLIVSSVAINPDRRPKDAGEWVEKLAAIIDKAKKQTETEPSTAIGSKPVLPPEPPRTVGPSAGTKPSPVPPPLPKPTLISADDPPPQPRPAFARKTKHKRPVPKSRGQGKLLALAAGGVLFLGLAVGIVIAVLPSGKRTMPTEPSAKLEPAKGGTNNGGDKQLPTPDPKKAEPKPPPKVALPKASEERDIEIAPGVKMTFCWVPPGECQLGSPKSEQDYIVNTFFKGERPSMLDTETEAARGKFKTDGFWMGKYEVTQAEWEAVMGSNPSYFDGKMDNKAKGSDTSRFPVDSVSWDMICGASKHMGEGFLDKINKHGGIQKAFGMEGKFRLPHEDEWEYACRGGLGNARPFYWGNSLNGTEANCDGNFPYGTTTKGTHLDRTCAVDATNDGKYEMHPWGLMHMHGNVWEWCNHSDYEAGASRVLRGGSWSYRALACRAVARVFYPPGFPFNGFGFRLIVPVLL